MPQGLVLVGVTTFYLVSSNLIPFVYAFGMLKGLMYSPNNNDNMKKSFCAFHSPKDVLTVLPAKSSKLME